MSRALEVPWTPRMDRLYALRPGVAAVPAPEGVAAALVAAAAFLEASGAPSWWLLSPGGQWHLLRPGGVTWAPGIDGRQHPEGKVRLFCGRPPRGSRWRRELAPLPLDPAPHYILGDRSDPARSVDLGPAALGLDPWPQGSCWGCMDAYVPWAVRSGLTYPLDVALGRAR